MEVPVIKAKTNAKLPFWPIVESAAPSLILSSLFINLLTLAFPIVLLQIYDRVIPNMAINTLLFLMAGAFLALFVEFLLRVARSKVTAMSDAKLEHYANTKLFELLLASDLKQYNQETVTVHLERLNSLRALKDFYTGRATITLLDLPFIFLYLAMIFFLGKWLVFAPIFFMIVLCFYALYLGRNLKNILHDKHHADEVRSDFMLGALTNIHTIKAFSFENIISNRYSDLLQSWNQKNFTLSTLNSGSLSVTQIISQLTLVVTITIGAILVVKGQLTIGGLAACSILVGRCLQPIGASLSLWGRVQSIRLARERIVSIVDMQRDKHTGKTHVEDLTKAITFHDTVYGSSLAKLNLSIPAHKTTILLSNRIDQFQIISYLLMGIYTADSGQILFDAGAIETLDLNDLREKIGYLSTKTVLFSGTLLENITLFQEEKIPEALKVMETLKLDLVFSQLPQGLHTKIDNSSMDKIPYGILQRIGLARVLLKKPMLILYDHADHGIDSKTEKIFYDTLLLEKAKCTIIMATQNSFMQTLADNLIRW